MLDLCLVVKWSSILMVFWKPDWKSLCTVQNVGYLNGLPHDFTIWIPDTQTVWYLFVRYSDGNCKLLFLHDHFWTCKGMLTTPCVGGSTLRANFFEGLIWGHNNLAAFDKFLDYFYGIHSRFYIRPCSNLRLRSQMFSVKLTYYKNWIFF